MIERCNYYSVEEYEQAVQENDEYEQENQLLEECKKNIALKECKNNA